MPTKETARCFWKSHIGGAAAFFLSSTAVTGTPPIYAPIAKENGLTITGLLRGDVMLSKAMPEIPLGHLILGNIGGTEYPVAAPDDPRDVLTVRDSREVPRTVIPRADWQFAHTGDGKLKPSDRHIHLNGGFQAGAGGGSFNYRFAQPSRDAQPTSSVFFPTDIFPFTDQPEKDPETGEIGGLLDRAVADQVVPKIFFSNTSFEYWGRVCALIHVSADGKTDAPISDNVRIYHFTGQQHFPGPFPYARGPGDLMGQQPESPLPIRYFWRSMVANMEAWVRSNTPPPPSSYPKIADGTLVPWQRYVFPILPGVNRPHEANAAYRIDFGPKWQAGILSLQPPKVGDAFPVLVPQVDADGNERDGVRLPEVTVPLATYASWNLRDPSIGASDQRTAFEASYIPFPKTSTDRLSSGDPRQSIAERYAGREDYVTRYAAALDDLVRQRWILPEDREAVLHRGAQEWDLATK